MSDDQRERLAEDLRSVASAMLREAEQSTTVTRWREVILRVAWELDPTSPDMMPPATAEG